MVQAESPQNNMQALVPRNMPEAIQLAQTLAKAGLMPDHLRGKEGDCLLIVMQAQRWGMDALSVAQCTSVVKGKLCYEGKLVAAALYSMGAVVGRIKYTYSGSGMNRKVVVSAIPRGETEYVEVDGTVEKWATSNDNWKRSPDDMLAYRGARQWARRHAPEALLGVYTPDEMEDTGPADPQVTVRPSVQMPQARTEQATPAVEEITEGVIVETGNPVAERNHGVSEAQSAAKPAPAALSSEPGMFGLTDSQERILLTRGKAAGVGSKDALLVQWPRIDPSNLNQVLADLREMADQSANEGG